MNKGKKGQVTLFILSAIVIFAVIVFLFYPRIKTYFTPAEPIGMIEECLAADLDNIIENISQQGGSINPKLYLAYQGTNVEYLCYTNEYFKPCVMQRPLLIRHIEQEIKDHVDARARSCLSIMVDEMRKRGYTVRSEYQGTEVQLVPDSINVIVNAKVTLTKEGTQTFNKFEIKRVNSLYGLASIATSFLKVETEYGNLETLTYMIYYPNLLIERLRQGDGSTVYILTDTENNDKFAFAVRSLAYPGGRKFRL